MIISARRADGARKMRSAARACVSAALGTLLAFAASAQESDLVIVDIKAIAGDVAENIRVAPDAMPLTVKAPLSVAADACGVPAIMLRQSTQQDGTAACVAVTSSRALEELVRDKIGR